jgi:hypothetical protein
MNASDSNMSFPHNALALTPPQPQLRPQIGLGQPSSMTINSLSTTGTSLSSVFETSTGFKDVPVKVHVRRPDKDNWAYLGRALVSQEIFGNSTRIVVRAATSRKVVTAFNEGALVQAEKRGNFIVVSSVESSRVVSWSLNALNNADTLRLLAIFEVSCVTCGKSNVHDKTNVHRRRIARLIREDKKRRHKRRRDEDSMIAAFARTGIKTARGSGSDCESGTPSDAEDVMQDDTEQ